MTGERPYQPTFSAPQVKHPPRLLGEHGVDHGLVSHQAATLDIAVADRRGPEFGIRYTALRQLGWFIGAAAHSEFPRATKHALPGS